MEIRTAVVFAPPEGDGEPILFQPLLLCPAGTWLCHALRRAGAERLFVVCGAGLRDRAREVFGKDAVFLPEEAPFTALPEDLPGDVLVVTKPVFLSGRFTAEPRSLGPCSGETGLFRIAAEALRGAQADALSARGKEFRLVQHEDEPAVMPLLDAGDFLVAQELARRDTVARHIAAGVSFVDPNTAYIGPDVTIGRGTTVLPSVILRGGTHVGRSCEIGPNTMILDCTVGRGTSVNASQCYESVIGEDTHVGPFAYVRPNSHIGNNVKIGDFVEVKNSVIGDGVKISHLTYAGDSDIGARVNLGCGTVTVNYDGKRKYRTVIGEDAFIGCNTNLVAPVRVGDGAFVAAGSTVTGDVPVDALAVARARQENKPGWAKRRREEGKL
ncbi:MAG TPA: DapH/DapD/GlmU-related protein [Oscillospiraceae bacterium]|nr:DapH/DapD/GlmU-related protein [Oscillospiraceae bacterium]